MSDARRVIAGLDEAGRGPLAGPVAAGAVILDPANPIKGLNDSKKLTARARAKLEEEIKAKASSWAVAFVSAEEIDEMNILNASMEAMRRAAEALKQTPDEFLVDGNKVPGGLAAPGRAIIGGDAQVQEIMAASILAKEARDRYMADVASRHPEYGFDKHKGYGTALHLAAIRERGTIDEHRKSFGPVKNGGATKKGQKSLPAPARETQGPTERPR